MAGFSLVGRARSFRIGECCDLLRVSAAEVAKDVISRTRCENCCTRRCGLFKYDNANRVSSEAPRKTTTRQRDGATFDDCRCHATSAAVSPSPCTASAIKASQDDSVAV